MSRTILITGATKGIGRATAEALAAAGHHVFGVARTAVTGFPGQLFELDLADAEATERALADLAARHPIDAVVNNVGLVHPQALGEVTRAALTAVLDLNLRTAVQTRRRHCPA